MHADEGFPLVLGERVTVGHQAMLHGCTVGDNSLIGIQSIVLNGARIGRNSLVRAGSLVTEGKTFPDGVLIVGRPAKGVREPPPSRSPASGIRPKPMSPRRNGFAPSSCASPDAEPIGLAGFVTTCRLASPSDRLRGRYLPSAMSELHKFIFDGLPVRGMLVRLTDGWQELLSRREAGDECSRRPCASWSARWRRRAC